MVSLGAPAAAVVPALAVPRPARYSREQILETALELLGSGGPQAVSVSAIARAMGAPSGSIYHRYPSKDHLLADLWLDTVEAFQDHYLGALSQGLVEAACSVLEWSRRHLPRARLLLLYRRDDLLSEGWPTGLQERAAALKRRFEAALDEQARTLGIEPDRVLFAGVDIPMAAVRRFLRAGELPPPGRGRMVREAVEALLRSTPRQR